MPHISLAAEHIGTLFGFPLTNSLVTTWLVMGMLTVLSFVVTRSLSLIPTHTQSIAELVIGGLYDFFTGVVGVHIRKVFPLLASLFLFIIIANWVGLLPGVGTVGFFHTQDVQTPLPGGTQESISEPKETFTPLFRGATADLNTTLALAIIAVVAIQYLGFRTLGLHYGKRFIDLRSPIHFFVGLLEIISDTSKIISFAFRLFGNIFAGEVLLTVMAFLMPFVVPLPFFMLELFVGFIQALVFSMLTAVFLNVALSHAEGEHEREVNVHG